MALDDVTSVAIELQTLRAAVGEVLQRRDAAIRQAFADGVPIGAIAQAANITRARVASILGHPFHRVGRPSASAASTPAPDH